MQQRNKAGREHYIISAVELEHFLRPDPLMVLDIVVSKCEVELSVVHLTAT